MSVAVMNTYEGKLVCRSKHLDSGSEIVTVAPKDNGGEGNLLYPTDLVGAAVGTCILTIMGLVADRLGVDIKGSTAHVVKEMAASPARRIGKLTVEVVVPNGAKITPEHRTRLEQGALGCPVKHSLHPDTQIDVAFKYL